MNVDGLKVSAHFVINRLGHITQFVSCDDRAWHAGASSFEGREQCNDFSIGIELEGTDDVPFEAVQYERLAALTDCLRGRYPLTAATGHSDIAPGRKTDPGPCFDWSHFSALAQWPAARGGSVRPLAATHATFTRQKASDASMRGLLGLARRQRPSDTITLATTDSHVSQKLSDLVIASRLPRAPVQTTKLPSR